MRSQWQRAGRVDRLDVFDLLGSFMPPVPARMTTGPDEPDADDSVPVPPATPPTIPPSTPPTTPAIRFSRPVSAVTPDGASIGATVPSTSAGVGAAAAGGRTAGVLAGRGSTVRDAGVAGIGMVGTCETKAGMVNPSVRTTIG